MISALKHLWNALWYSIDGIKASWRDEMAFRIETVIVACLIPLAFFVTPNALERSLLIGSLLMVLMVELINSAIEAVVNRISLDIHPLSKKAKDCGSAAVLIATSIAGIIWLGMIISHIENT